MQTLLNNKDRIFDIKKDVENKDPTLYSHFCIDNNKLIDQETISIIMTSSNRSKQVYFTLKTISNSLYKNIQIILVDDSNTDPIDINILKKNSYEFYIDFIKINRENKNWHNPLVNYNIGFKFIQGGKIIIQNSEVCHIGDIIQFVNSSFITNNNYYVFDVKASANYDNNEIIYNSDISTIDIYCKNLFSLWYQSACNNRKYHFLTSMTTETFKKINSFSYDYTMGSSYDDDDFLLKIISKKINIINIFHNEYNIGGIHLYHGISTNMWDREVELNNNLFDKKTKIYNSIGIYVDATEKIEDFERKYQNLINA
jgi:hypothetical protein